jgi:hypothetical protein
MISAHAAEVVIVDEIITEEVTEESAFSGWISLDANSHFMSYGANVWGSRTKDIGDYTLFEPSAGLEYAFEDGSAIYVGMWADINGLAKGDIPHASGLGSNIQEIDVWIGYYFSIDKFTIDFCLQSWMYNGDNEGIFDVTVSYDMIFSPYFKAHNRFTTAAKGQQNGTMYEIGGTIYEGEIGESFSYGFPIAVGFSINDFHSGNGADGYTYSFVGANASYALPIDFLGDWDLHGGLTYYNTNKNATGNADSGYLTANFGIGLSF